MFERISLKLCEMFLALRDEEGQGATEYAMVIGFLVVLLGVGLGVLGVGITDFLGRVAGRLDALLPAAA
jgi:Flp pilus assembly pilin Flp